MIDWTKGELDYSKIWKTMKVSQHCSKCTTERKMTSKQESDIFQVRSQFHATLGQHGLDPNNMEPKMLADLYCMFIEGMNYANRETILQMQIELGKRKDS